MADFIDRTGHRFGRLTVLSRVHGASPPKWLCQCDCGTLAEVFSNNLSRGHTTSCGCYRKENVKKINVKHGATSGKIGKKNEYPSTYKIWCLMRQRCMNPKAQAFKWYGARGITICERWNDYEAFIADMGARPDGCSLDRINNDGPYSPENCRWATKKQQARNKRSAHLITYKGETKSLVEWAESLGVPRQRLQNRIFLGWDVERAFNQPFRKSPSRPNITHE